MRGCRRSTQCGVMGERYHNGGTVALATGVTLPAVNKIVQQAKDRGPSAACLDHFRKIRLVTTHGQTESTLAQMTARHWTAVELDALLRLANRMKSLDRDVMSSGGNQVEVEKIRRHLSIAERRMGRRLFNGPTADNPSGKRPRVVREPDAALKQDQLDSVDGDRK